MQFFYKISTFDFGSMILPFSLNSKYSWLIELEDIFAIGSPTKTLFPVEINKFFMPIKTDIKPLSFLIITKLPKLLNLLA